MKNRRSERMWTLRPWASGRNLVLLIAIAGLLLPAILASGCGSSTSGAQGHPPVTQTPTQDPPKKWPDVSVTPQAVKTATAQKLGFSVAGGTIATVRTTSVEEPSPGRYNLTVKYNQPGACHTSSANWKVSDLEQSAYQLLSTLFKQPGVDRVEIEAFATELPDENNPENFEKVFRLVISRDATQGVAWDAIKGHTVLRQIASEFWATPKARDDTAAG